MFRDIDDSKSFGITTVNCLITDGGIGDLLCSLISVNYILKNSPWINLLIFVPDYMKEFAKHVLPSHAIVRNFTEAKTKYDDTRIGISTKWMAQHSPMRTHPVKYSFHALCDYSPTVEEMSYLKIDKSKIALDKFNLPDKYIVMQGAFTERVKTMPVETFNEVKEYALAKSYKVIVLGKEENSTGVKGIAARAKINQDYDLTNTINLMNKTSLLESAGIIANAKALVCMDGGLSHVAGFTNTPLIIGYSFASNDVLMPVRDGIFGKDVYPVVPDASLACRFCQTRWNLVYKKDFRICHYGDYKCAEQMTSKKYINYLEKIL